MSPNDPNAYGRKVVKYQYTDEGLYLATEEEVGKNPYSDQNKFTNDNALSSEDAYIEKIYYEYAPKDVEYEQDEATFVLTNEMTFTDDDTITLWVKAGSNDYKSVGTYNFKTNHAEFDSQYVSRFTNNDIVFNRKDIIAYRLTFANKHYLSRLYAYPSVTLKNSQKVLNYVNDKETIAIVNNVNGKFFTSEDKEIVSINTNAVDYARVTQRISEITKKVASVSNNSKKKTFAITWKIEAGEKYISGQNGDINYLPQKSGTFYDLLPLGSTLDPASVIVQNEDGQATFANLPDGMYLVAETKAEGEARKYELAKPFLVSLPLYTNGEWKHNVTISPKSEVKKIPNEKPVVPPSEKPKEKPKADTGISTNSSILMLLAVLLTASAGACMISQKEEEAC